MQSESCSNRPHRLSVEPGLVSEVDPTGPSFRLIMTLLKSRLFWNRSDSQWTELRIRRIWADHAGRGRPLQIFIDDYSDDTASRSSRVFQNVQPAETTSGWEGIELSSQHVPKEKLGARPGTRTLTARESQTG